MHPDQALMRRAIELGRSALASGNYPVGALIATAEGRILAEGHTMLHTSPDPTAHAEILALRQAASLRNDRYLPGCFLYSTLEPCPMCSAAAVFAKLSGIVFGATIQDVATAAAGSDGRFTWRQIDIKAAQVVAKGPSELVVHEGFMRDACLPLLAAAGA